MYGRGRLNLTSLGWKCEALAVDFSSPHLKGHSAKLAYCSTAVGSRICSMDYLTRTNEASCHGTRLVPTTIVPTRYRDTPLGMNAWTSMLTEASYPGDVYLVRANACFHAKRGKLPLNALNKNVAVHSCPGLSVMIHPAVATC